MKDMKVMKLKIERPRILKSSGYGAFEVSLQPVPPFMLFMSFMVKTIL